MTHRVLLALLLLVVTACGGGGGPSESAPTGGTATRAGQLSGLLSVDPGRCDQKTGGVSSGSYFRMVQSGGDLTNGPFVPNNDSPCDDATYTPLEPGTDGGVLLGDYQPAPEPAFDRDGHSLADRITTPRPWFAVRFGLSTNQVDPQSGEEVTAPQVTAEDGRLAGDLRAISASWNGQHFNQGSPKPDGSRPGQTRPVSGTYDPETGAYTLEWSSRIVGGPFGGFTGVWHLEGTLETGADSG